MTYDVSVVTLSAVQYISDSNVNDYRVAKGNTDDVGASEYREFGNLSEKQESLK